MEHKEKGEIDVVMGMKEQDDDNEEKVEAETDKEDVDDVIFDSAVDEELRAYILDRDLGQYNSQLETRGKRKPLPWRDKTEISNPDFVCPYMVFPESDFGDSIATEFNTNCNKDLGEMNEILVRVNLSPVIDNGSRSYQCYQVPKLSLLNGNYVIVAYSTVVSGLAASGNDYSWKVKPTPWRDKNDVVGGLKGELAATASKVILVPTEVGTEVLATFDEVFDVKVYDSSRDRYDYHLGRFVEVLGQGLTTEVFGVIDKGINQFDNVYENGGNIRPLPWRDKFLKSYSLSVEFMENNGKQIGSNDIPEDANEHCPGPASEFAGQSDVYAGCPNQEACATAPKGPDPDLVAIAERMATVKHKILVLSGESGVGKSTFSARCLEKLMSFNFSFCSGDY